MAEELKWHVLELEDSIVVIPTEAGHGKRKKNGEWEITDGELTCACSPKVETGEYDEEGNWSIYQKPIVYHECFVYLKRVKDAMANIGITD